ncbi:MAG: hypothetical protein GTO18_14790 [Anaerolineales bacterium]|nr:hypothetical protein [Anaerolineales bacterium]
MTQLTAQNHKNRLVLLSGPSCVGKGPLHRSLESHYPELAERLSLLVLYNSRAPRPGEKDDVHYHFRPRSEVERMRDQEGFIVMDVRGDLQALELKSVRELLEHHCDPFYEGNPFIASQLLQHPGLGDIPKLSIFLSPLSGAEVQYLSKPEKRVDLATFLSDVMRRKLLRRTQKQKGLLSKLDLENIERRATSAFIELQLAWQFDHIIPNHDGEDSENWDAFYYPIGDAWKATQAFAALLSGESTPYTEHWEKDFLH